MKIRDGARRSAASTGRGEAGDADEDDEPLPVDFHFYTPDPLLYNSKLHINEDSPMAAPRIPPEPKDEL